jgi:hypothetical protein
VSSGNNTKSSKAFEVLKDGIPVCVACRDAGGLGLALPEEEVFEVEVEVLDISLWDLR